MADFPEWMGAGDALDGIDRQMEANEERKERERVRLEVMGEYAGPRMYTVRDIAATADEEIDLYYPTGFPAFDAHFKGMPRGRIAILAAMSSHGKSAFALEMAFRVARRKEGKVLLFSSELNRVEIAERYRRRGRDIGLDDDLIVFHDAAPTTKTFDYVLRHFERTEREVAMLIFDYIDYTGEQVDNKTLRLEQALAGLHALAGQTMVPIVVVQQVNREPMHEKRPPQISDLSYCDFSQKVAGMVLMLHHPFSLAQQTDMADVPESWELMAYVRKNTSGPRGNMPFHWDLSSGKIWDNSESPILKG